ncbi:Arc family DNA-binding protein [Pseudomonas sp. D3]|uniref:Arc family DNA-binding protein n=1 Tax=Pseudomonas sp. D3 TaxID=517398 RepID=UPI0023E40A1C|nr:Arc family DNA-binding protein [Pseudomonas sp. D3]WET11841.1 Arc family DNA-binding protein [Pseudomonas sp. D3]
MSATDYDSRTADKFVVRLPDKLRAEIEAAANTGDRSMNSVFVQAVRQYLDGQNRQKILLDALANTVTTPMTADSMHIDDRVRMAANAGRYEWLRDRTCVEDADDNIMVVRGDKYFNGEELDREIDTTRRLARLEELHTCAD